MPKTSSADRINAAFEEKGEALNNPKIREDFLNGKKENEIINELVDMFNKQNKKEEESLNMECSQKIQKIVNHRSAQKIAHIPPRVNHISIPVTNTDRPPTMRPVLVPNTRKTDRPIEHVPPRILFNDKKQESKCEQKPAEMTIPSPLSHFLNETIIYKLFNKEYWKAKITKYNNKTSYYTVRYDDNDEEELTHQEINAYLIPPAKGEYWTEQQSGRRRSKRIEKIKFTRGYAGAVRALDPTWYNLHKQSEQEYKHLASTVIDEDPGNIV